MNAAINFITPNPAKEGVEVEFSGTGDDPDGGEMEYKWNSNIDGDLGSNASFKISSLNVGAHTITFSVTDDQGEEAQASIVLDIEEMADSNCAVSLNTQSEYFFYEGGNNFLSVFTDKEDCEWTAFSDANWIIINPETSGTGNGTIDYAVEINPNQSTRIGYITVEDASCLIAQEGNPENYSWKTSEWSLCDNGEKTREVYCERESDGERVLDIYCKYKGDMPAETSPCGDVYVNPNNVVPNKDDIIKQWGRFNFGDCFISSLR